MRPSRVGAEGDRRRWSRRTRSLLRSIGIGAIIFLAAAGSIVLLDHESRTSAAPAPHDLTFNGARTVADGDARSASGGAYGLVVATGIDAPTPSALAISTLTAANFPACDLTVLWGGAPTIGIPPDAGGLASGEAPVWFFTFSEAGAGGLLGVLVLNGSANPLFKLTGSGCDQLYGSGPVIPTGIVDSSAVAAQMWGSGGAQFVAAHSSPVGVFQVRVGEGTITATLNSVWQGQYLACTSFGDPTEVPAYVGTVRGDGTYAWSGENPSECESLSTYAIGLGGL